ncbi:hypothetical protein QL285_026972 [Trifolium repens]|nr:hypothetical protein QL285_026972 [Trifolium repens]
MGSMNDDMEFIQGIKEARQWGSGNYMRRLFAVLLASDQLHRPNLVWDSTWIELSDDIQQRQRRIIRIPGNCSFPYKQLFVLHITWFSSLPF